MNQDKKYYSPAEKFFTEKGLSMLLFRQGFIDETGRHREGEYRLPDGRLLEVKTDSRCFSSTRPTGNIPIEIDHPQHTGRKGWYHHCIENGVSIVLFVCCDDAECKNAVMYISIPMDGLKAFVTGKMQDAAYMKKHTFYTEGGTGNLCVPVKAIHTVGGSRRRGKHLDDPDKIEIGGKHPWAKPHLKQRQDGWKTFSSFTIFFIAASTRIRTE